MTHGWQCRFAIALASLTACLLCADKAQAVSAQLSWDYAQSPDPLAAAVGFIVYRGVGEDCAQLAPLSTQIQTAIPVSQLTVIDATAPVQRGPLCYEVSAYNQSGESLHSNRAMVQTEALIPAVPGLITVQVLVE
jgi:hypothetical protein